MVILNSYYCELLLHFLANGHLADPGSILAKHRQATNGKKKVHLAPTAPKTPELEMWANAQRDGRPAEYRWRPLFNAAKFG